MQCPACQARADQVIDSRPTTGDTIIRRRRLCLACGHRFTTYELRADDLEAPTPADTRSPPDG